MLSRTCALLALSIAMVACGDASSGDAGGHGDDGSQGAASGAGGFDPVPPGAETFGDTHQGSYHLGPVDFAQSVWTNSCGPYESTVENITGPYLAGVDLSLNGDGSLCDACALVTTNLGKQVLVHIVTTGVSNAAGDMDLSQEAYDAIYQEDPAGTPDNPRPMTWQLARCPDEGDIQLQYQTGANIWWTSLWVRNARYPMTSVAVKSANHTDWFELTRGPDGTLTDSGGFGDGAFDIQVTSMDGQVLTLSQPGFDPGSVIDAGSNFD